MTTFIEASNFTRNYDYAVTSFLPHTVSIPLSQEPLIDCKCIVKPGDIVGEGDIIASNYEASSFIHSSVPGKVQEIIPCILPDGKKNFAVKIQTSGKFNYLGKNLSEQDLSFFSDNLLVKTFKEKGIINTFEISKPYALFREISNLKNAQYLFVRMFDEDNFRFTDSLTSKFFLQEIIKGAQAVLKSFNGKGIILSVNSKAENLEEIKKQQNDTVKVVEMNIKRYPSGTKREMLSAYNRNYKKQYNFEVSKNDLFIDASTAYEAYKAFYKQIPSISRLVFFGGNCLNASGLLDVRIGTKISDIISQLGGFIKNPGIIIVNGMIVGNSVSSLDISITKNVKSITINSRNKPTDNNIFSCINCGSCRFICPTKISPDLLYNNYSKFKILPKTIRNTSLACTNCGLCNIVCPSRLPLCQTINIIKEKSLQFDKENQEGINESK